MSSYQREEECMSLPRLSESIIRAGATAQSFERGQAYWRSGAAYNTAIQGNVLTGECEGSSAPNYHVRVELDQAGILLAQCTCSYDYGGWCKHIVALLLKYLHEPERFSVREDSVGLLASLSREDLVALVATLLRERPELYDWVATAAAAPLSPDEGHRARRQPVDIEVYRRQVRNLFRGLGRYDPYGYAGTVVAQLREVEAAAVRFLDAGEAEAALEILLALLEEAHDSFECVDDSDGNLGGFFVDLGETLAEAILSLELSPAERKRLIGRLGEQAQHLADYGVDEGLNLALQAARHGWDAAPEEDDEQQAAESMTWRPSLVDIRLNVLERQGRTEEYLAACQQAGRHLRYTLKLCDLGRVSEAAAYAGERLAYAPDALVVARRLRELGHAAEAISIAECGLRLEGPRAYLAEWHAFLEYHDCLAARGRVP